MKAEAAINNKQRMLLEAKKQQEECILPEHPIEGLMKTTLESIRQMIDVNTILGDPVETKDGNVIMPVSRVTFGFASGGTQWDASRRRDGDSRRPARVAAPLNCLLAVGQERASRSVRSGFWSWGTIR